MAIDDVLLREDIPQDAKDAVRHELATRDEARANLAREREFFGVIANVSRIAICVVDPEGRITFANAAGETVLGITRERMTERSYNDPRWKITACDGGEFPDAELPVARVLATGEPVAGVRFAIERPDGERVLLSVNAAPLFNASGELDGVVTAIRDITEQVATEEALRRERLLRESLMEMAPFPAVMLDTAGKVLHVSDYLAELTGHEPDEVIGRDWFATFLPERDQSRIRRVFLQTIDDLPTTGTVNPVVTRDGREVPIEWFNKILRDVRGDTVGVLAIGREVAVRADPRSGDDLP